MYMYNIRAKQVIKHLVPFSSVLFCDLVLYSKVEVCLLFPSDIFMRSFYAELIGSLQNYKWIFLITRWSYRVNVQIIGISTSFSSEQ